MALFHKHSSKAKWDCRECTSFQAKEEDLIDFTKQYSWDAGCLIYMISFGEFPFKDYPLNTVPEVSFPANEKIPEEMKEILRKLLKNDSKERMGIEQALEDFNLIRNK